MGGTWMDERMVGGRKRQRFACKVSAPPKKTISSEEIGPNESLKHLSIITFVLMCIFMDPSLTW